LTQASARSLYDFLYLFRRTSWQMNMANVLFVTFNKSWNSPRGKTQFFAFIEPGIVEQRELLNLSEQPWRNPRLFYAQCGSKTAADLFGGWVSFAYGRGHASQFTRPSSSIRVVGGAVMAGGKTSQGREMKGSPLWHAATSSEPYSIHQLQHTVSGKLPPLNFLEQEAYAAVNSACILRMRYGE
jgi:hypothetical protein